jgi:diacylglycerol kinase (ATP)
MSGLRAALRNEAAFRQEAALCVVLTPIALWLGGSGVERALMVGSLALVLVTELLNSAVEAVVDRIGPEHHELSGRAKDIGSAAVFFSLANVVAVWLLVLTPRWW